MRFTYIAIALSSLSATVMGAACPFGELARRGMVDSELSARYFRGEGLGPIPSKKRDDDPKAPGSGPDDPPLLNPVSGILSPLGLGSLVPRDQVHQTIVHQHIRRQLEERDEDVNTEAKILTPKAHRKRGLIGGLLSPLSGALQFLDVPTPQDSGLKAIPGNDPDHQYQPPGPTDVRGDCPTLNTLANHGYLSRTGVTSFAEAANAIQEAYSMSFDIAVFLSALGLLAGGDPVTGKYTIGGQDSRVPNTLGPSLGIDRHGLFELDASISRGDTYFGDNHSLNLTRWNKLVSDANNYGNGLFNIEAMKRNAADAVEESRNTNPTFAFGADFAVIYATRALLARPLPNGTAPNTPDYKNVAPFYLDESFPEDWYRIPNSYSLVDLVGDIGSLFLFKPQVPGRNYQGRYVPFDLNVPTAPQDVGCFALTLLATAAPSPLSVEVDAIGQIVNQLLLPALGATACDISAYSKAGISNDNSKGAGGTVSDLPPGSDANQGSGSGITSRGQYNGKGTQPAGKSAGQTINAA
jgi:hypothetical protein